MTNSNEKAIMNLSKACRISAECADWAKEDMEYDNMRDDSAFLQIVENTEPESILTEK